MSFARAASGSGNASTCVASAPGSRPSQRHAAQQHIAAVACPVEQKRRLQAAPHPQPVEIEALEQARDVDAEITQEPVRHVAVQPVFHVHGTAPGKAHRPALVELVALGVTAEVVVVVEDEDPRLRAVQLAMEVRRRESADPAADDDEVVSLVECKRVLEALTLARQRVRDLEGARVRAAQPRERGRVVELAADLRHRESRQRPGHAERGDADVVYEIAPRDRARHAELAVGRGHGAVAPVRCGSIVSTSRRAGIPPSVCGITTGCSGHSCEQGRVRGSATTSLDAHLASTTSGFPFSTIYVASSEPLPLPTFFAPCFTPAGMNKTSPALSLIAPLPST